MTRLLLVLCLAAHALVPPPTLQRRTIQTHAIRNWWSGASSDRDWRAALREALSLARVLGEGRPAQFLTSEPPGCAGHEATSRV